jgi:hypothetical protein
MSEVCRDDWVIAMQCTRQEILVHRYGYTWPLLFALHVISKLFWRHAHAKGIWQTLLIHSSLLHTSFTAIIISVGLYYNLQLFTSCWNLLRLGTHTHTNIRVLKHYLSSCKHTCKPTNTYNTSSFSSFVPTQCCMQVHRWMVWLIVIEMHNEREHGPDCHWNKEHDLNWPFVLCFTHFALL